MRVPAALTLLFSLCCHLCAPVAILAVPWQLAAGDQISAHREAPVSHWVPRTCDARDLVQAPERQERGPALRRAQRVRLQRTTSSEHLSGECRTAHRPAYPARRRLCRLRGGADGDPPPA